MTTLAAEDQPRLSPAVCVRLVATGIGFRLMRSGVTVAVQALAVAFLVYVFAAGTIDTAVQRGAATQLAPYRAADTLLSRLRQPDTVADIIAALTAEDLARRAEYAAWGGFDDTEMEALVESAGRWSAAQRWADGLSDDDRAVLLGDATLAEAADRLGRADAAQTYEKQFREQIEERRLEPPGGEAALMNTLAIDRPALRVAADAIRRGHAAALRGLPPLPTDPAIGLGTDYTSAAAHHGLSEAGFVLDAEQLAAIQPHARRRAITERLIGALQVAEVRRAAARRARVDLNEVNAELLPSLLHDEADATWFADVLAETRIAGSGDAITTDALLDYAHHARLEARLAAIVPDGGIAAAPATLWLGLPPRTLLLVSLSCLVCVVGITNAMMMSVTERFTEIATMKCLGARSGSVLVLFLIESAVLGIAGGVLGVLLGLLLAAATGAWRYGTMIAQAVDALGGLSLVAVGALLLGIVLSMLAALLPSMFAARLPPMAAMRVE